MLRLYIQPKASKDQVIGLHAGEIKVSITAAPTDGKANAHLIKYLSKRFNVAKHQVIVEKGQQSRHKQVRIVQPAAVPDWLKKWFD